MRPTPLCLSPRETHTRERDRPEEERKSAACLTSKHRERNGTTEFVRGSSTVIDWADLYPDCRSGVYWQNWQTGLIPCSRLSRNWTGLRSCPDGGGLLPAPVSSAFTHSPAYNMGAAVEPKRNFTAWIWIRVVLLHPPGLRVGSCFWEPPWSACSLPKPSPASWPPIP